MAVKIASELTRVQRLGCTPCIWACRTLYPIAEVRILLPLLPLSCLMQHGELAALSDDELNQRVLGVGSALFQLFAVQSELGEPLNLNGDLISDLADKCVVTYRSDGQDGLDAMFTPVAFSSTRNVPIETLMRRFRREHTIFNKAFRPPMFRRERPSHFLLADPIPVTVPDVLKREGDQLVDDERPAKQTKIEKRGKKKGGKRETNQKDNQVSTTHLVAFVLGTGHK